MKLRNKKTGEIHEITQAVSLSDDMNKKFAIYSQSEGHNYAYRTLAELNEEWEDYEEPKEYWYINDCGDIYGFANYYVSTEVEKANREIGNLFDTKEEAEKAVEKLKAWKRLKDNGFKFEGTYYLGKPFNSYDECEQAMKDLDTLIGGEE